MPHIPSALRLPEAEYLISYTAPYNWGNLHVSEEARQDFRLEPLPPLTRDGEIIRPEVMEGVEFSPAIKGQSGLDVFIVSKDQLTPYSSVPNSPLATNGLFHRAAHYKKGLGIAVSSLVEVDDLVTETSNEDKAGEFEEFLTGEFHLQPADEELSQIMDSLRRVMSMRPHLSDTPLEHPIASLIARDATRGVLDELVARRSHDAQRSFLRKTLGNFGITTSIMYGINTFFLPSNPYFEHDRAQLMTGAVSIGLLISSINFVNDTRAMAHTIETAPNTAQVTANQVGRSINNLFNDPDHTFFRPI